jgi:uncharacterized protein YcfJ
MKKLLILSVLGLAAGASMAQEVGRVLSATPVIQQVAVPRQVCNNEAIPVQPAKSGAGAVLGAVAGGLVGNTIGHGGGRAVATLAGVVGGAALGDHIEGAPATQYQTVQNCVNQSFYENRTVGYNVLYEYGGKQYSVQMPNDPGPTVQLQVTPVGSAPPVQAPSRIVTSTTYIQPVADQVTVLPAAPVYSTPVYAAPYYPSYVAPLTIGLGLGYIGGYYGRGWGGGHYYRGGGGWHGHR